MTSPGAVTLSVTIGTMAGLCAPLLGAQVLLWMARRIDVSPAMLHPIGVGGYIKRPGEFTAAAVAGAAIGLGIGLRFGMSGHAAWVGAVSYALLVLAVVDSRTRLLPDLLTMPLLVGGLAVNAQGLFVGPTTALAAAAVGWTLLMAFRALSLRVGRKREGLGQGDAKLLAAIGAWVGVQPMLEVLILAAVGALAAGGMHALRRKAPRGHILAFGPFLAIAAVGALLTWPFAPSDLL